jgi:diacylglycerol kinase (ATP)
LRRFLVVTNPAAGAAEARGLQPAVTVLAAAADVRVVACADPDALDDVLAGREGRTVVVAGGDGSLHLAVAALHGRGELAPDDPLGQLPTWRAPSAYRWTRPTRRGRCS